MGPDVGSQLSSPLLGENRPGAAIEANPTHVNYRYFCPLSGGSQGLISHSSTQPQAEIASNCSMLDDPLLSREWFLVAWSHEISEGAIESRQLLGRDLVLWRSSRGDLHCWLDLCVHRGAKLSLGIIRAGPGHRGGHNNESVGDCLVCPYHGWEYGESAQCVRIPAHPELVPPAKARAQSFHVQERYGGVWVSLEESDAAPPGFPLAEEVRVIGAGPYRFRALGPRIIENALDVAHLGYVHAGLLGDPERLEIEDYQVVERGRGPEAAQIRIWQPNPDGTSFGAHVTYRYWLEGPLTVGIEKTSGERRFGLLAQVAPIDAEHSEMRILMGMNYGHDFGDDELRKFQDRVTEQDRVIVESQRPELLPLDLQEELHLRSDRMAIAYRKWLRKIGLRYGAC